MARIVAIGARRRSYPFDGSGPRRRSTAVEASSRSVGDGAPPRVDESRYPRDRAEVLEHDVLVSHANAELVFDQRDQGEHVERVEHVVLDERQLVGQIAPLG
jgi:hypothetical protein